MGTVSGTSISFGTPVVFYNATTYEVASVAVAGKVVIPYARVTDYYGFAVVFTAISSNATAENILGLANVAETNGNSVTVSVVGAINDQQSGLTPARKYYVDYNGSLTLSNTGIYLGKALSASQILIGVFVALFLFDLIIPDDRAMRPEELIGRADEEVRSEGADIDEPMCRKMHAIHPHQGPDCMSPRRNRGHRRDRPDEVRRPGHRDQPGSLGDRRFDTLPDDFGCSRVEVEPPHRHEAV